MLFICTSRQQQVYHLQSKIRTEKSSLHQGFNYNTINEALCIQISALEKWIQFQEIQSFEIPTVLKLQDVTFSICQLLSNEFAFPVC